MHTVFLHKDALGSSRQATGPGGGVLQDQLFYPWGQSWQSLGTWQEQGFAAFDYLHTSDNLYPTPISQLRFRARPVDEPRPARR